MGISMRLSWKDRELLSRAEAEQRLNDEILRLTQLQFELQRARDRYEAAITELERRIVASGGTLAELPPAAGPRRPDGAEAPAAKSRTRSRAHRNGVRTRSGERRLSLRSACFEDLRGLGLSVTQANRVLRYQREGRLGSPAGLDQIPGIPASQLRELKRLLEY